MNKHENEIQLNQTSCKTIKQTQSNQKLRKRCIVYRTAGDHARETTKQINTAYQQQHMPYKPLPSLT
eukprot:m.372009 g.372009  ORF g.372009 m.372009 type:complete len:67 (+) comp61310_c0_seq1:65-265(+)